MYDEDTGEDSLEITDGGALRDVQADVNALTQNVYDGRNFYVAAGLASKYRGFLAFSNPRGEDVSYYYLSFDDEETNEAKYPWMIEGSTTTTYFKFGQPVSATSELAGSDNTITLKANWVEIDPLTDEELIASDDALTLDVFERGAYYKNGSAVATLVVANDLLLQWTSNDENLDVYGVKTGDGVTLDEENTISYLLTTKLNSALTSLRDTTTYNKFASFTFTLNIDNQLKFANVAPGGNASIVFSSAYLKPVDSTGENMPTNIPDATVTNDGNGNYTITFNPANVPLSDDRKSMQIEINVEWCLEQYSYAATSKPIQISGLDFKLKEPVADKESFTLNSSANITGSMNMKTRSNIRFYYTAAYGLLNGSSEWQTYFNGNGADPVALVHALQFMDYKLADINLADDDNATLDDNTVKATYPGTVTVTPANMTIYMGGDDGYDAVVDGTTTGNDNKPSNSMPTPLFYVDVSGVTVEDVEDDITLTGAEGREWKFRLAGKDSSGTNLYYIVSTGFDGQDPVRVAFEGEDGKYHLNDTFDPAAVDELFTTYEISIYSGSAGTVLAQVDGKVHNVAVYTGTLTVRAVEETEDNPVVSVTEAVTAPVAAGSAAVTAPSGTTYTLNDTTVSVTGDGVGLLFDGIIDDATHNRTDALVEAIETDYRINVRDGYFQAQYLDLVDADNGNAWIKASNDVTVYWGYPEGTNQNTKFTLYHFTGLHRDGTNSGFDMEDISKSAIEVVDIEKTANGIAFDVEPGGFSPFVLVWEKPSWPIIIPDIPEDTTPELLNTYDHDAYIQGYPDGRVKPENNITRAEVATIFYRLLTDDARNYYYSTDSGFSDVKPGDWYNTAVSTMVNAGILTGYNDGSFRPNDPITRAEFATIAARFLSDPYSLQDRFYDTEGHWAEVYINRAAEVGWINGYNDGSFRPNKAITRAEAVTLVNNVLGREPHADYMLDDMITWPDNPKSAWYYEDIQEATNSHDYRWSSGKRYEIWTSLN